MKSKHDIIWLDTVDSTNNEVRRRISGLDNLSVLSALEQTSGRGQQGNTWVSRPGENLTFSIILKYAEQNILLDAHDQCVINEITSLSAVDFLAAHGIEAKIKWPNDIYVNDKKICGILIENSLRGSNVSHSIIGIGLNINQKNFDVSLPNPVSIALLTDEKHDLYECLDEFLSIFKEYVSTYLNGNGGFKRLRTLYLSQLWKLDEPAKFYHGSCKEEVFSGTIRGLTDIGNILVETEKGELKEFAFKEIGYIL